METIRSKDGTSIAFERCGAGSPLVLVHGTSADHTRWAPVLSGLDRAFTVYAVDRRGRGASGDAPNYDLEREIENVTSVIDAINQPVDILGHSFGGICALEAARRSPRVRGLILYEPPIASGAQDLYPTRVVTEIETLLGAGDREAVVRLFLREVAGLSSQEVEMLRLAPTWSARVAAAHTILREMHAATS